MSLILVYSLLLGTPIVGGIKCYSCANDFMVWQWRHFFLKRNYGLTTSDSSCGSSEVNTDVYQSCHSTCFTLFLNGTNKKTGFTRSLGVVRGCSSQYMTEDQHAHMGLGAHSKLSEIGDYLPSEFDQYELTEHWCFCASEYCNSHTCFSTRMRYPARRQDRRRGYEGFWKYPNSSLLNLPSMLTIILLFFL